MISRELKDTLIKRLSQTPAVALLGCRQVGKTTLARDIDPGKPVHYLDLERPSDLAKLADPELYLSGFADRLVILERPARRALSRALAPALVPQRRQAPGEIRQSLLAR